MFSRVVSRFCWVFCEVMNWVFLLLSCVCRLRMRVFLLVISLVRVVRSSCMCWFCFLRVDSCWFCWSMVCWCVWSC